MDNDIGRDPGKAFTGTSFTQDYRLPLWGLVTTGSIVINRTRLNGIVVVWNKFDVYKSNTIYVNEQLSTFVQLTKELFKFRTFLFEQTSVNDKPSC